jgi:hypothetical protein
MGFLSNLFGKRQEKTNVDVYREYADSILSAANIEKSDANILKATVYLCFAQIACIDSISGGKSRIFVDNMVDDAKKSILHLQMTVKELATNRQELEKILSEFPVGADVDGETRINGLAGWDAIYFAYAQEVIVDIANGGGGPMGVHGYAAIKVLEALRGPGKSQENFMDVSFSITEMTGEVIQCFR